MRFESCLAVLLTSFIVLASGSNDGDDKNPNIVAVGGKILHPKHHMDNRNWNDDITEKRSKRSLSDIERNTVLSYFNAQRILVGASDMNYVVYDVALGVDLDNWTKGCDYDTPIQTPNSNVVGIRNFTFSNPDHKEAIQNAFHEPNAFYTVRSIYVTGAAVSVAYCPTLIADGKQYNNSYLSVYGISTSDLFDGTVRQYTLGPACTRCQSNVTWCYSNLCRADCSLSIYGCCQISNGVRTAVCAKNSGASGFQAIGTAILHGLLLIICYCLQ